MKNCFSNATVMWNEQEILYRESLISMIPKGIFFAWKELNRAVDMERCETPILTPAEYLEGHIKTGFNLIGPCGNRGYLRPETTAGTYEAMSQRFEPDMLRKRLPFCMWQVGCSFRDEENPDTMRASKLRLVQFYQMEFQLFASHGSKAPYLETALQHLIDYTGYGGEIVVPDDLPHYSEKTLDWHVNGLEVAGCSIRKDWSHGMVFEIAIGLDRLVALRFNKK